MFKVASKQAEAHAQAQYPFEAVGVIVKDEYVPCNNIHTQPENNFAVSEQEVLAIKQTYGEIQAVIHSHPYSEGQEPRLYPSAEDMRTQAAFAVPFGIIVSDKERAWDCVWFGDECPIAPLEGRGFMHGQRDCYSLIRDFYRVEYNMTLLEFPRSWNWWEDGENLYKNGFTQAGFRPVSFAEAQMGDVFLATLGRSALRSGTLNHGGIYLGNSEILHHKSGVAGYDDTRISCRENINRYTKYIKHIIRHEAFL